MNRLNALLTRAWLALLMLLHGCSFNGGTRVTGWPQLRIVEHYVPHNVMRDRCSKYVPAFMSPEACAEFDFGNGVCHLWFSKDFPPSERELTHEREHCMGIEHAGETGLADLWRKWK